MAKTPGKSMQLTKVQEYSNNAKNLQICTSNPTHFCCQERAAGHWISNSALNTSENNKWKKARAWARLFNY